MDGQPATSNKYFAMMLHIDDDDLDIYEYRLLGHYRKVCGLNNGFCRETNRETAKATGIGVAKVRSTRAAMKVKGLITADDPNGVVITVTIVDRRAENLKRYDPYQKREGSVMTPLSKERGVATSDTPITSDTPLESDMPPLSDVIGGTPQESSVDAANQTPKELEELKTPEDSSSLHSEESRASVQSTSPEVQGEPAIAKFATPANASELPNSSPDHVDHTVTMVDPQSGIEDPKPLIAGVPLSPSPDRVQSDTTFNRADYGRVLKAAELKQAASPPIAMTNTVARVLLDDAPPGHEWWFAGDNAGVAHLLKGGTGRPLCKPQHWKSPNKCAAFMAFVACPECQRAYAESVKPKAPRPRNVVFDLIAKHAYGADDVTSKRIGGRIGATAADVRGCVPKAHLPTLEADLGFAYVWWANVKKLSAPRDALAICGMLNDWRVAGSPKPVRKVIYDKDCQKCLGSGVIMPVDSNEAYPCDCGKEQQ